MNWTQKWKKPQSGKMFKMDAIFGDAKRLQRSTFLSYTNGLRQR